MIVENLCQSNLIFFSDKAKTMLSRGSHYRGPKWRLYFGDLWWMSNHRVLCSGIPDCIRVYIQFCGSYDVKDMDGWLELGRKWFFLHYRKKAYMIFPIFGKKPWQMTSPAEISKHKHFLAHILPLPVKKTIVSFYAPIGRLTDYAPAALL